MKISVFFILFYCSLNAQYLDSLQTIIQSKSIEYSVKQEIIDSFFEANKAKIDSLELAECYHEYGKWFFKRSKKEKKI